MASILTPLTTGEIKGPPSTRREKVAHSGQRLYNRIGKVAEWFNASVLKTDVAVRLPRVRLPPLPP